MSLDAAAVLDFFGYMALSIRSCHTIILCLGSMSQLIYQNHNLCNS